MGQDIQTGRREKIHEITFESLDTPFGTAAPIDFYFQWFIYAIHKYTFRVAFGGKGYWELLLLFRSYSGTY